QKGELPFDYPVSFLAPPLPAVADLLRATTDPKEVLENIPIHIVCVPTERNGKIWSGALEEVIHFLASRSARPVYVIVESTISLSWLDQIVHARFRGAGWRNG